MKTLLTIFTPLLLALTLLTACTTTPGAELPDDNLPVNPAPQPEPDALTMFVGAETRECTGVAPQTCLLVRFSPDEDWTLFYDQIVGFTYEPGYEYELLVTKVEIENPPADASALQYTLVEIVQKNAVAVQNEMSANELIGTTWDLVEWMTSDGSMTLIPGTSITIQFDGENLSGSSGCNSYSGAYSANAGTLSFSGPGFISTMMACEETVMQQEFAYLQQLATATGYTLNGDQLTILTPTGDMTFAIPESITLENVEWRLNGITQGEAVVMMAIDENISLTLSDGQANGNAGCNNFFGNYELGDETLSFGPLGATRMLCEDEINAREIEFFSAIEKTTAYRIERSTLHLLDAEGNTLMSFTTTQ